MHPSPSSAAEFLNFFHGFGKAALRFRREGFAEIQFHGGNGQPPGLRRVAENVARQRQHRAGVGGVRHELR